MFYFGVLLKKSHFQEGRIEGSTYLSLGIKGLGFDDYWLKGRITQRISGRPQA